jgi:hypothetical protein
MTLFTTVNKKCNVVFSKVISKIFISIVIVSYLQGIPVLTIVDHPISPGIGQP